MSGELVTFGSSLPIYSRSWGSPQGVESFTLLGDFWSSSTSFLSISASVKRTARCTGSISIVTDNGFDKLEGAVLL